MPGYDKTGPTGMGPGTGGGRGFCPPENRTTVKNETEPIYGSGRGGIPFGGGRGRAWIGGRRRVGSKADNRKLDAPYYWIRTGQETEYLKNRAADIERELEMIRERLSKIEANTDK
jgi:hypothetical protein